MTDPVSGNRSTSSSNLPSPSNHQPASVATTGAGPTANSSSQPSADIVDPPSGSPAPDFPNQLHLQNISSEDMLGPFFLPGAPLRSTTYPSGNSPEIRRELDAVAAEFGAAPGAIRNLEHAAEIMGFKSDTLVDLKISVVDLQGSALPLGTKVHLWHASAGSRFGFPEGVYDNGAGAELPTLLRQLANAGYSATARLIDNHGFGRCAQWVSGGTEALDFKAPIPAHYAIGRDPVTGQKQTRAMHLHVAVELPAGYRFSAQSDQNANGLFESQLYFKNDPHAQEDEQRFGPNAGFNDERVIPDDGQIRIEVGVERE